MHPFKGNSDKSRKDKMSSLGAKEHHRAEHERVNNYLGYKHVDSSSYHEQHRDQSIAPGMKAGGRTKHHAKKPKTPDFARGVMDQAPPSPDLAMSQAGTGASPSPVPAPMQKRGGRVHSDVAEDKALIRKMVKPSSIKKADGGRISYPLKKGGADSGVGRLEYSKHHRGHKK